MASGEKGGRKMADPFELWRLAWAQAFSGGLQRFVDFIPGNKLFPGSVAPPPAMPIFGPVRIELPTMRLLEEIEPAVSPTLSTLIVSPFAVHEASIADFAEGHSLAKTLAESGAGRLALTYWKSATLDMRDYGIDVYLEDLNVAVDDLDGCVSLVGLCQGGWLAAVYAARFPSKVASLVLAGAPIDLNAGESSVTRALASMPQEMIASYVALAGGLVPGSLLSALLQDDFPPDRRAEAALQCFGDPTMLARFDAWNLHTVDLPGAYFIQTAEWIFRENRLARGCFPALGRKVALSSITAPIFVLAAEDDEVVSPPQATAVQSLCPRTRVTTRVEPGRHLSLFMGRRTVGMVWPEIGRWLVGAARGGRRGRHRALEGTAGRQGG
jgi:poly(3-hydroxybutyrate) depolymerase